MTTCTYKPILVNTCSIFAAPQQTENPSKKPYHKVSVTYVGTKESLRQEQGTDKQSRKRTKVMLSINRVDVDHIVC